MSLRRMVVGIASIAAISMACPPAHAGLTTIEQATESMMNSQGLISVAIGDRLGPDPGATLSFTSNVDPNALTFSYALAPGSTYLGQSASLSVAGAFNTTDQAWEWTSTGSVGAFSLAGTGSTTFVGDPMSTDIFVDLLLDRTIVSNVTYTQTATRTASMGTITVEDFLGNVLSSGEHTDVLQLQGPNAGQWEWDTGLITGTFGDFGVQSTGLVPFPNGGPGVFTARITPEPSTLALAAIALPCWPSAVAGPAHRRA